MAAADPFDQNIRYPFSCMPVFDLVMQDEGLCRRFLECVLGTKVGRLTYHAVEHEVASAPDARRVRLDAYLESEGAVFDIEMQVAREPSLGRRLRYYQSAIDTSELKKGEPFEALRESYVIFVCNHDPFGAGLPVYDIERTCAQDAAVAVGDGSHWRVLNARAWADEPDEGLRAMLEYVAEGNASDELTRELDAAVDEINADPARREDVNGFMTMEMSMGARIRAAREEGLAEGEARGLAEGEAKGEARMAELFDRLLSFDRKDDLERAAKDATYRDSLMREFGIA